MALLSVEDVRVEFGGILALADLTFDIEAGEICALIGPNGAGKTTLFNCVSRLYETSSGRIRFDGTNLLEVPAHRIARVGIARTFQNLALFPALTVTQNVMVGAHSRGGSTRTRRRDALEILDRLSLSEFAEQPAIGMPYGTLKRIEIARALAARPRLLCLDEPAAGLTHSEVDELATLVREIRDEYALTVLLVEHHMAMVMAISEHIVVLDFGSKIAEGLPDDIRTNPEVIEAYLGNPNVSLLEVAELRAGYGPVQVLYGVDFTVDEGEAVVILGANGAGKTTTLRALSGMIPARGSFRFDGRSMLGTKTEKVARAGIAHVPQGRGTLADLTVDENLRLGAFARRDRDVEADMERWYSTFTRLSDRRDQQAGSMSGGEQQMLAIARALMGRPRLVLLDEPSLGLAPIVTQELFEILGDLNREHGLSMLIVEQNAGLALAIAARGYVLESGTIAVTGPAAELADNDDVRRAYLGI